MPAEQHLRLLSNSGKSTLATKRTQFIPAQGNLWQTADSSLLTATSPIHHMTQSEIEDGIGAILLFAQKQPFATMSLGSCELISRQGVLSQSCKRPVLDLDLHMNGLTERQNWSFTPIYKTELELIQGPSRPHPPTRHPPPPPSLHHKRS